MSHDPGSQFRTLFLAIVLVTIMLGCMAYIADKGM